MPIVTPSISSGKSQQDGTSLWKQRVALRESIQAMILPQVTTVFNQALEDRLTALLGRPKGQHRSSLVAQPTDLECPACGRHMTLDFLRKGHYKRSQLTLWGWLDLSVPRAECICGHCPSIPFDLLSAYDRLWSDMDSMTCACIALDISLRNTSMVLQLQNGQAVSIGTLQRRVKRAAARADWEMRQKLTSSPAVIVLDALWGTLMVDTGEKKRDKKGRLRRVKRGVKIPLLLALGIDPVTGATQLLAWVQGEAENLDDWLRLLTILHERGIEAATGLQLFIHDGCAAVESALDVVDFGSVRRQRCVFHKLSNVLRNVVGEEGMGREAKNKRREEVLTDACWVYAAPTEQEARERARVFRERWGEREAKAVATLERDFEATLTYYVVAAEAAARGEAWRLACLRTTSPLEGRNGCLRAKWRQARVFWSGEGQRGALWLVCRQWERTDKTDSTAWITALMAALLTPAESPANFPTS